MAADRPYRRPLHPLHAVILAGTIPLFLGALLSDLAYASSYEIQWKNFASWLILGGILFAAAALLAALIGLALGRRGWLGIVYLLLLLATVALGFVNLLVHAKDAWATMPDGLVLSAVVAVVAIAATSLGFSAFREQAPR